MWSAAMKTTNSSSGSKRSASQARPSRPSASAARRTRSRSSCPCASSGKWWSSTSVAEALAQLGQQRRGVGHAPSSRAAASKPASANPSTSGAGQVNGTFTMPTRRPGGVQPVPERRRPPEGAVDQPQLVAGLVPLDEVPEPVTAGVDAGDHRRPGLRSSAGGWSSGACRGCPRRTGARGVGSCAGLEQRVDARRRSPRRGRDGEGGSAHQRRGYLARGRVQSQYRSTG